MVMPTQQGGERLLTFIDQTLYFKILFVITHRMFRLIGPSSRVLNKQQQDPTVSLLVYKY